MGGRDRFGDVVVGGIAGRRAGSEASIDDDSRRSLCPSPAVGKRHDFPVGLAKTNTWAAASVSWCDLYRSLQNMAEKLRERTAACLMDRRSFWSDVPVELIDQDRSEEHTSELQSLMRISYAVFCLKKKKTQQQQ